MTFLDPEKLTTLNYPGIERYYPQVRRLTEFGASVAAALGEYNDGEKPYIDILVAEIDENKMLIREVIAGLGSLSNVPFVLIVELRKLQQFLGLIASYPQFFRENYRSLGV